MAGGDQVVARIARAHGHALARGSKLLAVLQVHIFVLQDGEGDQELIYLRRLRMRLHSPAPPNSAGAHTLPQISSCATSPIAGSTLRPQHVGGTRAANKLI